MAQARLFDDDYYGGRLRTTLTEESRKNPKPLFGVVIETEVIEPGKNGRIVVRCSDGTIIDDTFDTEWNLTHLAGALVLVERDDDGDVSISRVSAHYSSTQLRPRPRLSVGARMTLDRRHYIWDGNIWYGATDYTIAPTSTQQHLMQEVARLTGADE